MSRVLVTGASRGIGRAITVELAARGHEVIATARDVDALAGVPAALRLALDVTDQASVDAAVEQAGRIDVLINNAGATVRAPIETVPISEVMRLFELNTLGALRMAQAVLPAMRQHGDGRITFVSSVQGRLVIPLIGAYAASKWALEALAETLAIEAGHFGVTVQLFQPGAVSSDGAAAAPVHLADADPYGPLLTELPRFRADPITAEEVARAVAASLEDEHTPLRIPIGRAATSQLAARKLAPEDEPFTPVPIAW